MFGESAEPFHRVKEQVEKDAGSEALHGAIAQLKAEIGAPAVPPTLRDSAVQALESLTDRIGLQTEAMLLAEIQTIREALRTGV